MVCRQWYEYQIWLPHVVRSSTYGCACQNWLPYTSAITLHRFLIKMGEMQNHFHNFAFQNKKQLKFQTIINYFLKNSSNSSTISHVMWIAEANRNKSSHVYQPFYLHPINKYILAWSFYIVSNSKGITSFVALPKSVKFLN